MTERCEMETGVSRRAFLPGVAAAGLAGFPFMMLSRDSDSQTGSAASRA
ncbi:MAG: twin-arginine translocation signal domain-containing protein [Acidobacteriota bacterium]